MPYTKAEQVDPGCSAEGKKTIIGILSWCDNGDKHEAI